MTSLEEIMTAAMVAPTDLKAQALRVLRGQARVAEPTSTPPASEPLLTLRELAGRIKLSPCTLWRWKVPGHEFGGRRRYRLAEVTAYLQSQEFQRRQMALRAERRGKIVAPEFGGGLRRPARRQQLPMAGNKHS
mgnify:FL=1